MNDDILGEDVTPDDSVVPIYLVPLTEDDINERIIWEEETKLLEQQRIKKESIKESAIAKLKAIGLTEEEAKAIAGV